MWLQFEQYAIPKAQAAAIHDRVDEDAVLAGLVRLWGWAQRERQTQVTATELRGFFRVDCVAGLIAFDFLEPLPKPDLFRVRGTSRYILNHEARSKGGRLTGPKNLMRGKQRPGSAPAAARLEPGSLPAAPRHPPGRGPGRREKGDRDLEKEPPASSSSKTEKPFSPPPPPAPKGATTPTDGRRASRVGAAAAGRRTGRRGQLAPPDDEVHQAYAQLRGAHEALCCWPKGPTKAFRDWWREAREEAVDRLEVSARKFAVDVLEGRLRAKQPVLGIFLQHEVWWTRLEPRQHPCAVCERLEPEGRIAPETLLGGERICFGCRDTAPEGWGQMSVAELRADAAAEQARLWQLHEERAEELAAQLREREAAAPWRASLNGHGGQP